MSRKKTTSSPREAFLADVLARPEEDGPRLVYADWLTDHGETESDRARGEFIHLQCRMAGLEENSPERLDLQPRERDLLADHSPAWMKVLPSWARKLPCTYRFLDDQWPDWVKGEDRACTYRRGFVAWVSMLLEGFINAGSQLYRVTPLEGARLHGEFEPLLKSPLLERLTTLDLDDLVGDADTIRLASCPALARLRSLCLDNDTGRPMTPKVIAALASSAYLKSLSHLELSATRAGRDILPVLTALPRLQRLRLLVNDFSAEDIRELASLPELGRLHALSLSCNRIGDQGLAALADSPHAENLRELDLTNNGISAVGLARLARSAALAGLRNLCLGGNPLSVEGATTLARSSLTGLTVLRLWRCELTDEVVAALFRSTSLNQLRVLELTRNPLTTRSLGVLASSPALQHLHTLHLSGDQSGTGAALGGEGIRALASSPHLARLDALGLAFTGLGDADARLLADAFRLPGLRRLDLRGNGIGPAGAEVLAGSSVLADLRFLDLRGNPIGDRGALALARSPHLQHVREMWLWLGPSRIGKEGRAALKKRFGTRVTLS
jgi:uncharacterized protein (TIGR02996 family)